MQTKAILLALAAAASGCKVKNDAIELKGYTGDVTTRSIDYAGIFGEGNKTVTYTNIIAFESSYKRPQGGPAGNDEGVRGAYDLIRWFESEGKDKLFGGQLEVTRDKTTLPENPQQVQINRTYVWEALGRGATAQYSGKQVTVDVKLRVVLGPSIVGRPLQMPEEFRQELARAMVEDDVVSYNGHIWSTDIDSANSPWSQADVDANTTRLADAIRSHPTTRTKPGILYMNACRAEKIEAALMDALLKKAPGASPTSPGPTTNAPAATTEEMALTNGEPVAPILLSHRNYSNFGFFPDHDATLLIDTLFGCSLPSLMLDLTTTAKGTAFASQGAGYCDDEATAKKKLAEYLAQPGLRQRPESVIVVAYDIINGKLKQEDM